EELSSLDVGGALLALNLRPLGMSRHWAPPTDVVLAAIVSRPSGPPGGVREASPAPRAGPPARLRRARGMPALPELAGPSASAARSGGAPEPLPPRAPGLAERRRPPTREQAHQHDS